MLDVKKIREDFPMIVNHPELIYFDSSATTYKPYAVINAVLDYYYHFNSNIERGEYETALKADKEYARVRDIVGKMINCDGKEVAFVANITEALNQIAYGLKLEKGDVVLSSYAEHASNLLPWFRLKEEKGIEIKYLPMDESGNILLDKLDESLTDNVKVISFAYVSNVLGTVAPVKKICEMAHKKNILVVIDAAQAIGHLKIDVKDLDVDLLAFSSHKMCGPDGVGVLYGKYEILQKMPPLILGGGMNSRFNADGTMQLKNAPEKFEAGTPNIEGVIGLGKACEYLMDIGLDNIHEYEKYLRSYMLDKVKKLDNVIIYNENNETGPLTFNIKDIFAQDAASYLANKHIAVRSGNHCAKILHNLIGTDQSLRASLYFYNTTEEIDHFVTELAKINLDSVIDIYL